MDNLLFKCRKYIYDPKYVFKSCDAYVIVLKKLPDTITNESRSNISDPMYANYRANKLRVILIINKFDSFDIIKEIQNTTHSKKITYETNKIVEVDDYNMDLDKRYTTGIHYFKTINQTFYWKLIDFNPTYTGKIIEWHNDGNKKSESEWLDGEETGKFVEYYKNGNKKSERELLDGIEHGEYIAWYENGNKKFEGKFLDIKEIGKWIYYYENSNKRKEGEYLNGKKTGKWIKWYDNGNKRKEGEYLDGKKTGECIKWYPNSNKKKEGEYLNGEKTGEWIKWYPDGNIKYHKEFKINKNIKKNVKLK